MDWTTLLTQTYVWIPASLAALYYFGAPLVVRGAMWFNTRAPVQSLMPEQLPPEAWQYFGQTSPSMAECGFRVVAYACVTGMVPSGLTYFALWMNESAGQWAMVTWMNPGGKKYVEFLTVFGDASSVLTNNSGELSVFKHHPSKDTVTAPWIADPRELYRLHCYRETLARPQDVTRYVPAEHEALGKTLDGVARELAQQEEFGYFERTVQPAIYRMTFPGAFLMTWKELFPAKPVRKWLAERRARSQELAARGANVCPPRGVRVSRVSPYRGGDPLRKAA
jgi:hypothetical protein